MYSCSLLKIPNKMLDPQIESLKCSRTTIELFIIPTLPPGACENDTAKSNHLLDDTTQENNVKFL